MKRLVVILLLVQCLIQCGNAADSKIDELIASGNARYKTNDNAGALADAQKAIEAEPKRFEGHALAALVLLRQGKLNEAATHAEMALQLGPEERKKALTELKDSIVTAKGKSENGQLSPDSMRKFIALKLILEDAEKAKSTGERTKFLKEFLEKSDIFTKENPEHFESWFLRAAVALDSNNSVVGHSAGQNLLRLNAGKSSDEKTLKLMARLERAGWLASDFVPVQITAKDFVGKWNILHSGPSAYVTKSRDGSSMENKQQEETWTFSESNGNVIVAAHRQVYSLKWLAGSNVGDESIHVTEFPPGIQTDTSYKNGVRVESPLEILARMNRPEEPKKRKKKGEPVAAQPQAPPPGMPVRYQSHFSPENGTVLVSVKYGDVPGIGPRQVVYSLDRTKTKLLINPIQAGKAMYKLDSDEDILRHIEQHGKPWSTNDVATGFSAAGTQVTYAQKVVE